MKAVFFCGARSPFGAAHVAPLLASRFQLLRVFLPTPLRWATFREQVTGGESSSTSAFEFRRLLGQIAQGTLLTAVGRRAIQALGRRAVATIGGRAAFSPPDEITVLRLLKHSRVPVSGIDDLNSDTCLSEVAALQPDIVFCAAFPQIIRTPLLDIPRVGAVNFHPSLLPRYRGAHPIYWALATGEPETGVTAHFMNERIDAGPVIAQIRVPIDPTDYYHDLYGRILAAVPELIRRVEEALLSSPIPTLPQDESQATTFRNDREIHHRIFWRLHRLPDIIGRVRAGDAFAFFRGRRLVLHGVRPASSNRSLTNQVVAEPGTIVDVTDHSVVVAVDGGCIELEELSYLLGRMSAAHFVRYFKPSVGEPLA